MNRNRALDVSYLTRTPYDLGKYLNYSITFSHAVNGWTGSSPVDAGSGAAGEKSREGGRVSHLPPGMTVAAPKPMEDVLLLELIYCRAGWLPPDHCRCSVASTSK